MAYYDDFIGRIFPTRDGVATGASNERQMLDHVANTDGFRTAIRTLADGTEVMLRTRRGRPDFTTKKAPDGTSETDYNFYMETGQLNYVYPGESVATRLDPANIHFLDIPTTDNYLLDIHGYQPNPGQQKNKVAPSEGMPSLATGYPLTGTLSTDDSTKDRFKESLVLKKITDLTFPASMFSGKMRQFLQAQRGAKLSANPTSGMRADVVGLSAVLTFFSSTGESIVLGYYLHGSVGIYAASDSTWYLLNVTGGPTYAVTAYKLRHSQEGRELVRTYKSMKTGGASNEDLAKIESYVFAHSTIDLSNPISVGSFVAPDNLWTIAYGWKFNTSGSTIRTIAHQTVGSGGFGDKKSFYSYSLQINIEYANGVLSCSGSSTFGGEWLDGWGYFNIFAPVEETGIAPQMELVSLAIDPDAKPAFAFSDVPIYGIFGEDDAWTPVTISKSISNSVWYEQYQTGLTMRANFFDTYDADTYAENGFYWQDFDLYVNSKKSSTADSYYEKLTGTSRYGMDISIGGWSLSGHRKLGTLRFVKCVSSEATALGNSSIAANAPDGSTGVNIGMPQHPDVAVIYDYIAAAGGLDGNFEAWVGVDNYYRYSDNYYFVTRSSGSGTFDMGVNWTLVIPAWDCNAVYVASDDYDNKVFYAPPAERWQQWHSYTVDMNQITQPGNGRQTVTFAVSYIWNEMTPSISSVTTDPPAHPDIATDENISVSCWSSAATALAGSPSNSYYGLFHVSNAYPYYDHLLWVHTSYNHRYSGSEISPDPAQVASNYPFVGWA